MPNLPPLPFVDGNNLLFDNSAMETLMLCHRMADYSKLRRRRGVFANPAQNFGTGIHVAMSYRYRHCPDAPDEAHNHIMAGLLDEFFTQNPQPDNDFRTPALAKAMVELYNKYHKLEPWRVLQTKLDGKVVPFVEFPGIFELGALTYKNNPVVIQYTVKIDLAVEKDHRIWTVDHKTSSVFGKNSIDEQQMSAQHLGYCWGFLKATGTLPAGFIVNFFRVRGEIEKGVLDPWTKQKTTGPRTDDFCRVDEDVNAERLEEWRQNTLVLIQEFLWHHERDYMPQRTKNCVMKYGRCQFYDICHAPPRCREELLYSSQFKHDDWTPLNQVPKQKT
jgi:hypothetical protein